MFRDLEDSAVNRQVVMPCRYDQIGPGDKPILIDPVMVDKAAPRRLGSTYPLEIIRARKGPDVSAHDIRLIQYLLDSLNRIKDFDEARIVVEERAVDSATVQILGTRQVPGLPGWLYSCPLC